MFRRTFLSGVGLLCGSAFAAGKPDFSGTWKMNIEKSEFGPIPKPNKFESKIQHKDPELKINTVQAGEHGEMTTDVLFMTDGNETTNKIGAGEMKSKAKWDGKILIIDSKMDFQGTEVSISEKWDIAEDGKSMTIDRILNTPQGDLPMKVIMEKQ